jgi:hypothetical protein
MKSQSEQATDIKRKQSIGIFVLPTEEKDKLILRTDSICYLG